MSKRDCLVGFLTLVVGIALGIAICPRKTGTALDSISKYYSGFCIVDGVVVQTHGFDGNVSSGYNTHTHQSVLMDGYNGSKVIGIEYRIDEFTWRGLSEEDKKGWTSCHYLVKSGLLLYPFEREQLDLDRKLQSLNRMYSKILLTAGNDKIPGKPVWATLPQKSDDIPADKIAARDASLGTSTQAAAKKRMWFTDPKNDKHDNKQQQLWGK